MRGAAAGLSTLAAFLLYHATLLPDFDLGDSASFQTLGGEAVIRPRDGYPLYFALGRLLVPFFDAPAPAMNLLSAIAAALACGAIVLAAIELSGSTSAAVAAALLFAGSYTFWSQAVTAEVYALHILLVAATLLLLLRWSRAPTYARLAAFFAVYALAFGNHLSMVLLLPAYAAFLLTSAPDGWRSLLAPRVVLTAVALASLGALQYAWNLSAFWRELTPPEGLGEALAIFWFDVTKTDWREVMVMQVPASAAAERAQMYLFDLRQQFGWAPLGVAAAGAAALTAAAWRRAGLLALIFAATAAFALGYNVGDVHVFLLPPHLILALLVAPGIVALQRTVPARARSLVPAAMLAVGGWNVWHNYPALDRSDDRRPAALVGALTAGMSDRDALFLTDLNWQVQNGLTYYTQHVRPDVLHLRIFDVLLYAPALVRDNQAVGRQVFLGEGAARALDQAYGPMFVVRPDTRVAAPSMRQIAEGVPSGARYVLAVLEPTPEFALDRGDLADALRVLQGGDHSRPDGRYLVVAGRAGRRPNLVRGSDRPFRDGVDLDGVALDVRMESWLPMDTIRRMGFGHVIANRNHALIVERGVSLVVLDDDGRRSQQAYAAGIYAAQPRYQVLSSR